MSDDQNTQPPDYYSVSDAGKILGFGVRRVQQLVSSGEIVGEKHSGSWRLASWSVNQYLEEHGPGRPRVSRLDRPPEATESPEIVRELMGAVNELEREIGRLEGRRELEEITRSTLQSQLDRERERADELQRQLEESRQRGFWSRLFGGSG